LRSTICIQTQDFDVADQYKLMRESTPSAGAIVTFSGLVREMEADRGAIDTLIIEHYPNMTERLLKQIINRACIEWDLLAVTVIHRVGELLPNEQIVFVGVASHHRHSAFSASQFIMDHLKTKATLWKRVTQNGHSYWLDAKRADFDAATRWDQNLSL
jgi:molybdopterin synthase catalytic subunit